MAWTVTTVSIGSLRWALSVSTAVASRPDRNASSRPDSRVPAASPTTRSPRGAPSRAPPGGSSISCALRSCQTIRPAGSIPRISVRTEVEESSAATFGTIPGSPAQVRLSLMFVCVLVWAYRPRPELVGVEYGPDVLDPAARQVECVHRHGDAVPLSHQAGLAVDAAFQDRQAGCPGGDVDEEARDLPGAFDRAEHRADQPAAVTGRGGAGVEERDEGADVLGFPCLPEVPDEAGLPGPRGQ